MSILTQLHSITERRVKRVGRGVGSGVGGHTVGRGTKGHRSREGGQIPLWFEGGQLPIIKRLPMMRGKGRLESLNPAAEVTLSDLDKMQAETITLETLKLEKVVPSQATSAKVIATGTLKRVVSLAGIRCSAGAKKVIIKLGGTVTENNN